MSIEALYYGVAVINVLIGLIAAGILLTSATKPPFWDGVKKHLHTYGMKYAWVVATLATLGSLFLSEIAGIPPCPLCWWQRIFMYPLPIMLGVAIMQKSALTARLTGIIMAVTGGLIAGYHFLLQRANFWIAGETNTAQNVLITVFETIGLSLTAPGCAVNQSCSAMYLGYWGFYSIPVMAFVSFFTIAVLLFYTKK